MWRKYFVVAGAALCACAGSTPPQSGREPQAAPGCVMSAADDAPDKDFVDADCDGVDGSVARAVFVAPSGDDNDPGTPTRPVATIGRAMALVRPGARDQVLLSQGRYDESVTLVAGASLYGGYDADLRWRRDRASIAALHGSNVAIAGSGLKGEVHLELLSIESAAAKAPGESSYGVLLTDNQGLAVLREVHIIAGDGAAGVAGADGVAGAAGQPGGDGNDGVKGQKGPPAGVPGAGGAATCGPGGGGGQGGWEVTPPGMNKGDGYPGAPGSAGAMGGAGGATSSSCVSTGGRGGDGAPGVSGMTAMNGAAAARGSAGPKGYVVGQGGDGTSGGGGTGGGGGGGGGGYYPSVNVLCNVDTAGGGGGGGGGGCGGSGGKGGGSGGGSFAVFVSGGQLQVEDSELIAGAGGAGGAGGKGGLGGLAGKGGKGGAQANNAGAGGKGGDGAAGLTGGGGAGGHGGPSHGIYTANVTLGQARNRVQVGRGGAAGAGGLGGPGVAPGGMPGSAAETN